MNAPHLLLFCLLFGLLSCAAPDPVKTLTEINKLALDGKWKEVDSKAESIIGAAPKYPDIWAFSALAKSRKEGGNLETACEHMKKAVASQPENADHRQGPRLHLSDG